MHDRFLRASPPWARGPLPDRYVFRPAGWAPRPSSGQFMVAPMVVLPVVRHVVSGSEPSDFRALYVVDTSVDLKAGVEMPESRLLPAEVTLAKAVGGGARACGCSFAVRLLGRVGR